MQFSHVIDLSITKYCALTAVVVKYRTCISIPLHCSYMKGSLFNRLNGDYRHCRHNDLFSLCLF